MNESEVRRLHLTDEQWNRTSASWKELKPKRNFNELDLSDETVREYRDRLLPKYAIPYDVLDQWLYEHYYNTHTVDNYGWIDYSRCHFSLERFDTDSMVNWRIIESYTPWVRRREALSPYRQFGCSPSDREHWQSEHTWRTPPVVVDVTSLPAPPPHSDVGGAFQLIEGHTRLGHLLAIRRCKLPLRATHQAYVLRSVS